MALGSTQINITVKAQRARVGKRNGRDKRERQKGKVECRQRENVMRQERLQTVYTNRGMGRGGKERQERLQTVYTNRGMGRGEKNDRGERDTLHF